MPDTTPRPSRRAERARSTRPIHDIYMPAMPPLKLCERVAGWLALQYERARTRRRVKALLAHDDRMLADMGLCRESLMRALREGRSIRR